MTNDVDQILLLLVGLFGSFTVLLAVLARIEARLGDPPEQRSWSPRRWVSLARQASRNARGGGREGK